MNNVRDVLEAACNQINFSEFKNTLKNLRKDRGVTQEGLALSLDHSGPSYISDLENPEKMLPPSFRLSDVVKIAAALKCSTVDRNRLIDAFLCAALIQLLTNGEPR